LAGKKQSGYLLRFQISLKPGGIDGIVFNRIAGPHHLGAFESRNRLENRQLHINRQRSAHAVDIDFVGVQPLGFQKKLVRQLVGKLDDLVFNRRAIPRPRRLNLSAIHRRAMHVLANDAMRLFRRKSDIAGHLRLVMRNSMRTKAEGRGIRIARLLFKARPVDGASVQPRRRPGLKPASAQPQLLERFAQQNRCRFA